MALVVFLRGVNVGGHKAFQPSALAKELVDFGVVNVGAAGTFVVRKTISQARLRDELLRRLPFKAELMISPSQDVLDLASDGPFAHELSDKDVSRYVSVLAKRPDTASPSHQPSGWRRVASEGHRGRRQIRLESSSAAGANARVSQ